MKSAAIPLQSRRISLCSIIAGVARAVSSEAVRLDRTAPGAFLVPSSHGRLASSSVVAGARATRRTLYSSTERFPGLPRSTVWRHCQSWQRGSGSTNAVLLDRAVSVPSSHYVWRHRQSWRRASGSANALFLVRAAPVPGVAVSRGRHERLDERCIPPPSGFSARCQRRASGSTNAVLLVRAVPPRAARCLPGPLS